VAAAFLKTAATAIRNVRPILRAMVSMIYFLVITCEHGGNRVPARYRHMFDGLQRHLRTHRGYDLGALAMAREIAASLSAPLIAATVTRLLVDLNRSIGHRDLHSEATRHASPDELRRMLATYYRPYRAQAEELVGNAIAIGRRVIHISSHSFTPRLNGVVRTADIGLLYDPARPGEADICGRWKAALRGTAPALRVRRNYPYAGKNDGLTSHFRRRYPPSAYVGIELEINQVHVIGARRRWAQLRAVVVESLRIALASMDREALPRT
jgi:predicted N-formylglutamate amidohydrolase